MARGRSIAVTGVLFAAVFVAQSFAPAFADGNPPWEECGVPKASALYNKFQYSEGDETFSSPEVSRPPGLIIDLDENGDGTYDYELTDDDYVIVKIVSKVGGDDQPDPVDGTIASSGTLSIPRKLSHVTFCFEAAGEPPPEEPEVDAEIVCSVDEETGEATYTLNVTAPAGVTTDPADGAEVSNEDTEVTVTWAGGEFTVTADETEDCSDEPQRPTVSARIVCEAGDAGEPATFTLEVTAPAGVTTDPADGTVVSNEETDVTVTWAGGTFEVAAEPTDDCSVPEDVVVDASIVCTADADGDATYRLDIEAPEGVRTEPEDGTVVPNRETTVTFFLAETATRVVRAAPADDCSVTPEGDTEVLGTEFERELAKTGLPASFVEMGPPADGWFPRAIEVSGPAPKATDVRRPAIAGIVLLALGLLLQLASRVKLGLAPDRTTRMMRRSGTGALHYAVPSVIRRTAPP